MFPVTQVLNHAYSVPDAEGLHAVTTIMPVQGAKAEVPLWNRLRHGMMLNGVVLQREQGADSKTAAGGMASFKVQVWLDGEPPHIVLMQLPAQTAVQQQLNMQVLNPKLQNGQAQVKWAMQGQPERKEASGWVNAYEVDLDGSGSPEATLKTGQMLPASLASTVDLSPSARQLQKWLSTPINTQHTSALHAQSVASQHPEKPQLLAEDLKYALDNSGLFYESHLKQATLGVRAWQTLLQEPQNQPQFSAPEMVSQQLQVLEQQQLIWHGEVWPGQPMQWQVTERQARTKHQSEEVFPQAFFSNLSMHLPQLGEIKVRITMLRGRFTIRVQAAAQETRLSMSAARPALLTNMHHAGLSLEGLQISEDVIHAANQT